MMPVAAAAAPPPSRSIRGRIRGSIVVLIQCLVSVSTPLLTLGFRGIDIRIGGLTFRPSTSLHGGHAVRRRTRSACPRQRQESELWQIASRASSRRNRGLYPLQSTIDDYHILPSSIHHDDNSGAEQQQSRNDVRYSSSMVTNTTFQDQFSDVIPEWLIARAHECGYTHPTHVQADALRAVFRHNGTNVVLQAATGSGKTLSYLLPCLSRIDPTRSSLQAVIVVPTRELGLQVAKVARRLASGYVNSSSAAATTATTCTSPSDGSTATKPKKILVMNVLQGSHNRRQRAWAWAEPPHVVIGTPGELLDMISKRGFKRYNSIRTLVVDEVDACLLNNMGSVGTAATGAPSGGAVQLSGTTLHELLSKHLSPTFVDTTTTSSILDGARRPVDRDRLTVFCSATIPQPRHFVKQCVQNRWMLSEPVHLRCRSPAGGDSVVDLDDDEDGDSAQAPSDVSMLPSTLEHQYVVCNDEDQQLVTLRKLLQRIHKSSISNNATSTTAATSSEHKKLLIFCDPRRPMKDMADIIRRDLERVSASTSGGGAAIVSVLSLEDSLTDRAAAMSAFRGDDVDEATEEHVGPSDLYSDQQNDDDDVDDQDGVDGSGNELVHERTSPDDVTGSQYGPSSSSPRTPPPPPTPTTTTRILLSTDLAARGLDIVDITHVVHYDLPINADAYVHRSGRAGRFGRLGRVLSIVPAPQEFALRRLLNKIRIDATCVGRQQTQSPSQANKRTR